MSLEEEYELVKQKQDKEKLKDIIIKLEEAEEKEYENNLEANDYMTTSLNEEETKMSTLVSLIKNRLKNRQERLLDYKKITKKNLELFEIKDVSNLNSYQNRLANIQKYLMISYQAKKVLTKINSLNNELEINQDKLQNEQINNIVLEDKLLEKFNEITKDKYSSLRYEDLNKLISSSSEDEAVSLKIYKLLLEKEDKYDALINKRNEVKNLLNSKEQYKKLNTLLNNQARIIKKHFNTIKRIEELNKEIVKKEEVLDKLSLKVTNEDILKILYEFSIVDTYDISKVNKEDVFKEEGNYKEIEITESDFTYETKGIPNSVEKIEQPKEEVVESVPLIANLGSVKPIRPDAVLKKVQKEIPDLNLPTLGLNMDDNVVNLDNKKYIDNKNV